MKDDDTTNSHYFTNTFLFGKVERMDFFHLGVKGFTREAGMLVRIGKGSLIFMASTSSKHGKHVDINAAVCENFRSSGPRHPELIVIHGNFRTRPSCLSDFSFKSDHWTVSLHLWRQYKSDLRQDSWVGSTARTPCRPAVEERNQ